MAIAGFCAQVYLYGSRAVIQHRQIRSIFDHVNEMIKYSKVNDPNKIMKANNPNENNSKLVSSTFVKFVYK